jgi:hypothetical protein
VPPHRTFEAAGLRFFNRERGQPASGKVIKHATMKAQRDNLWRELCIAAAFEENPMKLTELVSEISSRMAERQEELADRVFERLSSDIPIRTGKYSIQ